MNPLAAESIYQATSAECVGRIYRQTAVKGLKTLRKVQFIRNYAEELNVFTKQQHKLWRRIRRYESILSALVEYLLTPYAFARPNINIMTLKRRKL